MQLIKYGVVERSRALRDLLDWSDLYVAGRLHKPVATLKRDATVAAAERRNRRSALAAAMLLLPQRFSWDLLLQTICGLSYRGVLLGPGTHLRVRLGALPYVVLAWHAMAQYTQLTGFGPCAGDVRMLFGAEDGRKVKRIVEGSAEQLRSMYNEQLISDVLPSSGVQCVGSSAGVDFQRTVTKESQLQLMAMLPWVCLFCCSHRSSTHQLTKSAEHCQSQEVECVDLYTPRA